MTARNTTRIVRLRTTEALTEYASRLGVSATADELGVDESTVRRRKSGTLAWDLDSLLALICRQRDEEGAFDILDALTTAVREADTSAGDPANLHADLLVEIADDSAIVARAAESLRAGTISPRDAGQLRDAIRAHRRDEAKLLRDLDALIDAAQGARR